MKMPVTTAVTSRESFRQYVNLLRELHLLARVGREETAEADGIRDRMDEPWECLDEVQIRRVRGLSADLCSMEGPVVRVPPLQPTAESTLRVTRLAARKRGDWDEVLEGLRDSAPYSSLESVAYLRGDSAKASLLEWRAIAEFEIGAPVVQVLADFDEALRRAPENQRIRRNRSELTRAMELRPPVVPWELPGESELREAGPLDLAA